MTDTVLVLNGPNLNLLGTRDPSVYGAETLADVEQRCRDAAGRLGLEVAFAQSNREGELVEIIHQWREKAAGIVINPAAYSHTSVAIRDALEMVTGPVVEVHISNIHAREEFRHHSFVSGVATGVIAGLGTLGYELALQAIAARLK